MINKIKKWISNIKIKRKISSIEKKVLKFKLHKWQRKFILADDLNNVYIDPGRATGKTLAWDLRFILRNKCPILLNRTNRRVLNDGELDFQSYYTWHYKQLKILYKEIVKAGISVAEIKFYN